MPCSPSTFCRSSAAARHVKSFAIRMALLVLVLGLPATAARAQQGSDGFVINSVNLGNFQVVNNVLTAQGTVTGTLAGLPFTTTITNFALQQVPNDPATPQAECSVLHLALA